MIAPNSYGEFLRGIAVKRRFAHLAVIGLIVFLPHTLEAAPKRREANWVEVESPHFLVFTDGKTRQAQDAALRFELVRAFFQVELPGMRIYPKRPILVLAAKDQNTYKRLEPPRLLKKGALQSAGIMVRDPDKIYILLRLDVPGNFQYNVIYHEFTHVIVENTYKSVPLWLNEGLAQFYGELRIEDKKVVFGMASVANLRLLNEYPLLPLRTLFAVDFSSPYYNRQHQGTIFYAESWALTHYLVMQDRRSGKNLVGQYLLRVNQGGDPVTTAAQVFGDLGQLEKNLDRYVRLVAFYELVAKISITADKHSLQVRKVTPAESEALRGDFLVRVGRYDDAKPLLVDALQQEPNLSPVEESLGMLALRQLHPKEARGWFSKAEKTCPQCYMARLNYSAMSMKENLPPAEFAEDEANFRAFMTLNPLFAPSYGNLADLYLLQGKNLDQAHMLVLQALGLEPGNIGYYVLTGEILLKSGDLANAGRVAERAITLAKTPEDRSSALKFYSVVQQMQSPDHPPVMLHPVPAAQ